MIDLAQKLVKAWKPPKLVNALSRHSTAVWLAIWLASLTASFAYLTVATTYFEHLEGSAYAFKARGVNEENVFSRVDDEGQGSFVIHPGTKPVTAALAIKKSGIYRFDFSIDTKSKFGNILFIVQKNNSETDRFNVRAATGRKSLTLWAWTGDTVEIRANNNGDNKQDWGRLDISHIDHVMLYLSTAIGLTWLVFFYYMYKRNQASPFLAFYFVFLLGVMAEKYTMGIVLPVSIVSYGAGSLMLAIISSYFYQQAHKKNIPLAAVFASIFLALCAYLIPVLFLAYYLNFNTPIDQDTLYAVFQTNVGESVEFVGDFFDFRVLIIVLIITSVLSYFFWQHKRSDIQILDSSLLILAFLLSSSLALANLDGFKVPHLVMTSAASYHKELQVFRSMQERRKANPSSIIASKEQSGELYVVVLGESLNKHHMSLYGYARKTTPFLDQLYQREEIIRLDSAFSTHTLTMQVLSLSLTEASQDNGKDYYESVSIVELFNAAGFETTWLTNQNLLGRWDNHVSVIANQADKVVAINNAIGASFSTRNFDGSLLPHFEQALENSARTNKVIFVHLIGSHLFYCNRFPNDFAYFDGNIDPGTFGKLSEEKGISQRINCYDNSVLYGDKILAELINKLNGLSGVTSSLVYMADHADDVIKRKGHNPGNFTYDMTQIPLLFWFSPDFRSKKADLVATLKSRRQQLFSNDRFYDTLVGWTGISTGHYTEKYDLASDNYAVKPNEAVTLHGRVRYTDEGNYKYWQSENTRKLIEKSLDTTFLPHRVNSIGRLKDIWQDGFRAFEVDILFDHKGDGRFYVGDDDGAMGYDLEKFLDSVQPEKLKKLWLDFKNLNKGNSPPALAELERLNLKYEFKEAVILESNWKSPDFSNYGQRNWQTSFYLPNGEIMDALDFNDPDALRDLANRIASQIKTQDVFAISFDQRAYPFVKNYLEKLMPEIDAYHVRHGTRLSNPDFFDETNKSDIYSDPKTKTILIPYKSHFDL